ncbi:HIT family protein [Hujiaoplasma nucleasis]|uniref:HIT family protein n=1 Tax=Hujiaoplasma nucleasis TaxID=2725268 RepID=A0A7L6N5E7_9MOLU|nr:HIT family protein [Hujiaoplasma nucleasis]QLY40468.1 HIT family protein [Hujiaoplasma nucleasis]
MNCIFCKIIEGEIPSYKVYEDEYIMAFLDISQVTKGHTLIVPKKHVKNIFEMDEDVSNIIFKSVPKLANAIKKSFKPIGLNIISNNEKPLQSVDHFHIHLVPRYEDDGFDIAFKNNQANLENKDYLEILEKLKENI